MGEDVGAIKNNQRLKDSLQFVHQVPADKLTIISQRILAVLDKKGEVGFSSAEQEKLCELFALTPASLQRVFDSTEFIFEQATYFGIPPRALLSILVETGMQDDYAKVYASVWKDNAVATINKFKSQNLTSRVLEDVNWRIHLQLAEANISRLKEPSAIMEFNISNKSTGKPENIVVEFTHGELYNFFQQLETIQEQLDNLG